MILVDAVYGSNTDCEHQESTVDDDDKILRIDDVAEMTGIPEPTLRRWRIEGRGPRAGKFGKRLVYRRSDVRAWIDDQFEPAAAGE